MSDELDDEAAKTASEHVANTGEEEKAFLRRIEVRVAIIAAVVTIGGALITGAFSLAVVGRSGVQARSDFLRSQRQVAYSAYVSDLRTLSDTIRPLLQTRLAGAAPMSKQNFEEVFARWETARAEVELDVANVELVAPEATAFEATATASVVRDIASRLQALHDIEKADLAGWDTQIEAIYDDWLMLDSGRFVAIAQHDITSD